jgi:hypothetical protein
MELIDWLVVGSLAMSLINTIAIMGLGKKHEDLGRTVDHLIVNAMIMTELLSREDQENNADE